MSNDTVKGLLEEVKNLSELMLDLAYSAVFFKNKEIAKEVMILLERFEDIEERLYEKLFVASRGNENQSFISVIELTESGKNVAMAARNLADMVLEEKELHPVIHEALEESEETIKRVKLAEKSILAGKTLRELKLGSEVGVAVIGIRRGEGRQARWIFRPRGGAKLEKDDILMAVGQDEACEKFARLASGKLRRLH